MRALFAARELAESDGTGEDGPGHLLAGAAGELPDEALAALTALGWRVRRAPAAEVTSAGDGGSVFKRFTTEAKRSLASAARAASEAREPDISPARIAVACLAGDEALARDSGVTWTRVRSALSPFARDTAAIEARPLGPDGPLARFLEGLPDGADSVGILAGYLGPGTPEQSALLVRNKITAALLERARGVFRDP